MTRTRPTPPTATWTRLAAAALALVLAGGGCSVVEVIDGIGEDPKAATKPEPQAGDDLPAVPEGSHQAKLRAYYNRRPKQVEEDPDDPIVTCRLHTGTQFMRRKDCTLRGGSETG